MLLNSLIKGACHHTQLHRIFYINFCILSSLSYLHYCPLETCPHWPQRHCFAKDNLKLLIFLCPLLNAGITCVYDHIQLYKAFFFFLRFIYFMYMNTLSLSSDTLEEGIRSHSLQMSVSHRVAARNNSGWLEEQPVLLTTEPSLQPHIKPFLIIAYHSHSSSG
jgi:hypothetical protein